MNFRKSKQDVVSEVYYRVDNSLRQTIYQYSPHSNYGYPAGHGGNMEALMHAITIAITEAVKTVVENTYTDEELEEDLGLVKKD